LKDNFAFVNYVDSNTVTSIFISYVNILPVGRNFYAAK